MSDSTKRSVPPRLIGRQPNLTPPIEILLRYRARLLDPLTAPTLRGQRIEPTIYLADRLLARQVNTVLPGLEKAAAEHGLRTVVTEQDTSLAGLLPEDPIGVRVQLVPTGEPPFEAPDAWRVLQTYRAQNGVDVQHVGLDHLMTAGTDITGVPFVGGHGIGGVPFVGGHGVGSASQQYGVPGLGGRTPVMWMGGRPRRHREFSGRRPVVAVLDTAIGAHPWLSDEVVDRTPTVEGEQIGLGPDGGNGMSEDPFEGVLDTDAGHGTFIAGLVHQLCPDANILAVQIMPTSGAVAEGDLMHALWQLVRRQELAQKNQDATQLVDVINLSLGYYHEQPKDVLFDSPFLDVLVRLSELGVAVVASAGNDSTDRLMFPAAFAPYTGGVSQLSHDRVPLVSVGALNPNRTFALFSNAGPWITCFRPGAALVSTMPVDLDGAAQASYELRVPHYGTRENLDPDNYYGGFAVWSGTSFAAPVLAGQLAASMLRARADLPLENLAAADCVDRGWHAVSAQTKAVRP